MKQRHSTNFYKKLFLSIPIYLIILFVSSLTFAADNTGTGDIAGVGDNAQANNQLDIVANTAWAVSFTVQIQ